MIFHSWTYYYFIIYTNHFLQLNLIFFDTRSYEDFITWFICVVSTQLYWHYCYILLNEFQCMWKILKKWEMFDGIKMWLAIVILWFIMKNLMNTILVTYMRNCYCGKETKVVCIAFGVRVFDLTAEVVVSTVLPSKGRAWLANFTPI